MSKSKLHIVGDSPNSRQPAVEIKAKAPPKPAGLSKIANQVWDELGPELVKVGLLTVVDGAAFTLLCRNIADYESVLEKLKTVDDFVDLTPNKYKVQSVWFTIRNRLHDDILRLSKEFGLTPAARSGMKGAHSENQLGLDLGEGAGKPTSAYSGYKPRRTS
ncbi:P27 family phage terminase small subunit [Acinetobacter calcoaceticus]|uniref:P27 family phage terminase small subunit n=1 Tax=Acinetobacter calcoaceticus TaxID=471 RepID=UPI000FDA1E0E|nr:P27 family phage terminase small subunit [Acinetobacter calcoaceticus]